MPDKKKEPLRRLARPLRLCIYALLLALACMLVNPLTALACGGLFPADAYTEQSAERLIFAVDPGKVTLYEQIHYTGSPKDFAWVLPVPAVPSVDTAPISLFQTLDQQTAPRLYQPEAPRCNTYNGYGGAPAPSSRSVNVYSSGAVGPYSYNVIGSSNPQALTQWLTEHKYAIPAESRAEMQPYIAAHMLFLAMRLQGNANTQDMLPVKITYASNQAAISIPLRMATPMGKENLQVLVWVFAHGRYVPQNYQSLQINYTQIKDAYDPSEYQNLVSQAISKADGHGFITEYAQPSTSIYASEPQLATLTKAYSYITRMYTSIAPAQINLDPTFVAATGQPNVSAYHEIANPAASQPLVCPPSDAVIVGAFLGGAAVVALGVILFVVVRRRRNARSD
ncbi:MAG TPA: DUF2330 domain-containing protein [Ktedonobacteraceae bacterium]